MNDLKADAAYIHVPFCRRKCGYCDFYSLDGASDLIPGYLNALKQEIRTTAFMAGQNSNKLLNSVYFGGGTPNLLPIRQIGEILELLDELYGLSSNCEITLEANPESLGADAINELAYIGINRLSLGLQAVQGRLLKSIGRKHNADDFQAAVTNAANAGISKISADLMFGLPGQTIEDVDKSLDFVLKLPISHISCYSLIIEPDTPFFAKYAEHPELLPDDSTEREMYHYTIEKLQAAGMPLYEISNAAIPGSESRHNLVYWHAREYYGFGPSAHSYLAGTRRGNFCDLKKYISVWQTNSEPFASADILEIIDKQGRQKEMLLLGLRLIEGVSFSRFQDSFGTDMQVVFAKEFLKLQNNGLIVLDEKSVRLSAKGLDFANQVFMEFI